MRVIIAGSRSFENYEKMVSELNKLPFKITQVISGHAIGADQMAEWWSQENNIPCLIFKAQWDKYGKAAGYKRNVVMANNADALVAFWDGKSKGTKHMINIALEYELETVVIYT